MKKIYLSLAAVLTVFILQAQIIPNSNLESWTNFSTYDEPDDWSTSNPLTSSFSVFTTEKSSDSYKDTFAAKLITKQITFPSTITIPGILTNGNVALGQNSEPVFTGGSAYTVRPVKMSFWYKYSGGTDTGLAVAYLTRWNTDSMRTDTVGSASFDPTGTVSTYTKADMVFNYTLPDAPDTLRVIFSTFNDSSSQTIGTTFFIDAMSMEFASGVAPLDLDHNVYIYPNPVKDVITVVDTRFSQGTQIKVYDILGNLVAAYPMKSAEQTINLSGLAEGMYIYSVVSPNAEIIKSGRLVKVQ